ncbi:MAG: hypothetical protein MUC95_05560 [Spirochaetes bacterium]|nr:hypothetical protein [Spirochaetota bacterium]
MTNIIRHSQATNAEISIGEDGGMIELKVEDNGKGISDAETGDRTSLGIIGMRERVKACGGSFSLNGIPGKGTCLEVKIPKLKKSGG